MLLTMPGTKEEEEESLFTDEEAEAWRSSFIHTKCTSNKSQRLKSNPDVLKIPIVLIPLMFFSSNSYRVPIAGPE